MALRVLTSYYRGNVLVIVNIDQLLTVIHFNFTIIYV